MLLATVHGMRSGSVYNLTVVTGCCRLGQQITVARCFHKDEKPGANRRTFGGPSRTLMLLMWNLHSTSEGSRLLSISMHCQHAPRAATRALHISWDLAAAGSVLLIDGCRVPGFKSACGNGAVRASAGAGLAADVAYDLVTKPVRIPSTAWASS